MTTVLVDAGPLVASIDRRDQWHEWSSQRVAESPAPLVTCESVISEAWFLLRRTDVGRRSLLELLDRGGLQIGFHLTDNLPRVVELVRRYENVPMSLADGCLVRMSEIFSDCVVLTLDSDFHIYRRNRRRKIPLLIPPDV